MKCYYELLEVARDASIDDIKKAYRKLALKWHPDKNLDNVEEAKEQFQLIQQAWETLSDPHERTWYDNHREAILKGGKDYKDDSINLFPYFSATCFKGYGDDASGFYTIYREVFEKLATEDAEFTEGSNSDEEIPNFGNSQSSYEDVVHNFYAYWQSYNTKKSYSWLDPYDTRNIPNRRIFRLVEKENKKMRDKAKRERNEQVRNLVAFIRKRDKRVQMYAAKLAERARENFLKAEEHRKAHLLQRQKLLREQNESEWCKFSNMEAELKKIETNLTEEFEDNDKEEDNENDALYCIACNKIFKTGKAFMNHENSRKHKEKVNIIKHIIIDNDENHQYNSSQEDNTNSESSSSASGVKLATDSQMPDFLLAPHQSESKQLDNDNNEDVSIDELISDDENDLEYLVSKKKEKKTNINAEDAPVVTSEMESTSFISKLKNNDDDITSENELISDQEEDSSIATKPDRQKKKKKYKKHKNIQNSDPKDHISDNDVKINEEILLSKKQRKKLQRRKATQSQNDQEVHKEEKQNVEDETEVLKEINTVNKKLKIGAVKKVCKREEEQDEAKNKKASADIDADVDADSIDLPHCCLTCSYEFLSKNKLFEHLKKTGHSVHISELQNKRNQQKKGKASKKKDNSRDKKKH